MTFTFDGTDYTIPDNLEGILVSDQQGWSATYGANLCIRGSNLFKIPNLDQREVAANVLFMDCVVELMSYYSTIPLDDVRKRIDFGDLISLLGNSQLTIAAENQYLAFQLIQVATPASVTLDGSVYTLVSPPDSVTMEDITHDEYVNSIQLAEYMVQLAEGDWSNFHALCAGYIRLPGEILTDALIDPAGARALLFQGMDMQNGMGFAQYFIAAMPAVLNVLNTYTQAQIIAL